MRALKLRVKDTRTYTGDANMLYQIREDGEKLVWYYIDRILELDPDALVIPRCGQCHLTDVTPKDAEEITGLYMPAALDRLWELVHESEAV